MSKSNKFKDLLSRETPTQQEEALKRAHTEILKKDILLNDNQNMENDQNVGTVLLDTNLNPVEAFRQKEKEKKKSTFEMNHTRQTYFIRNDLIKRLNQMSQKQKNGFKTYIVNYALEKVLDEIEKNK